MEGDWGAVSAGRRWAEARAGGEQEGERGDGETDSLEG